MWTKTNILFASAVMLSAVGAANAADLIIEEPAAVIEVASNDWSGGYIGGHVGYGAGTVEWESLPSGAAFGDYPIDGFIAGAQLGANFQSGNIVYGIEGDISWSGISGEDEDVIAPSPPARDIDWTASLRGRLGFATEALLVYATGGLAVAQSTLDYDGFILDTVDSNTHVGWTVGVGAEFMVTDDLSLRGEYRYSDYGAEEYQASVLDIDTGFVTHTATVGVNFHF